MKNCYPRNTVKFRRIGINYFTYLLTSLSFLLFSEIGISQTTNSYTSSGTYSWTCPIGVTSVTVECWGGGGAGGGVRSYNARGAGGAGGAYAKSVISVTPGNSYTVTVGGGGNGDTRDGNSGGDSWFNTTGTVLAKGGAGGQADNGYGGNGTTSGSIGTTIHKGGDGADASNRGAGGGGAGSGGNGGSGLTSWPYSGGTGTSTGGGDGGDAINYSSGNGNSGSGAGGGGSGAYTSGSNNYSGGDGADGRVDITYTIPSPSISGFSPSSTCSGSGITVKISGSNFTGATAVQFNGIDAASYTVVNSTTIHAVVPDNATTGHISVTTSGGTGTSSGNFTVYSNPTISGTMSVCIGSATSLSGTPTAAASNPWVSSSTGIATVNGSGVVTGVSEGTSLITYTNNHGCTDTGTVTVNPNPVTAGVTICQGGSGTISASSSCSTQGPYSVGPNDAGSGSSGSGSGSWSNPTNIESNDNNPAVATISSSSNSQPLYATDYGFAIPTNATIQGVQVDIGRTSNSGSRVSDQTVQLYVGGSPTGNNYASWSAWGNYGSYTNATYGSSSAMWGMSTSTLTPSVINASNFGVYLVVQNTSSHSAHTASVDYVEVTVTYTIPGDINWYTVSSGGSSIGTGSPFNPVGVSGSGLSNTNTAGTTTFYAECSTYPGCRTAANFVINAGPSLSQVPTSNQIAYYKFNGNANDETGNDNGTLQGSPSSTTDRFGNSMAAYSFNGSGQYVSTANSYSNPSNFTISIWFKTSTSNGGKLIGFGNAQTGQSSEYDRHIYMNNAGQIYFGVYPSAVRTVHSPNSYNDGQWHLATATLSSSAGMSLYIDGALVASDPSTTTAQNYTGYWKIGYDNLNGWTSIPSSFYFSGLLDDALIYSTALTSTQVATLYNSPDGAGNDGPVCSGSALTLSATTVSGAGYAWTGPNSFSSSSQNPTLTYAGADAGTYTVVVTASDGCTSTAYTNVVSSSNVGLWQGSINSNWNNGDNWCSATVPDISTDVTIPSPASNMPEISDDEYSNNVVINSGATLKVNSGGTLQIAGSITNSGTFIDTSGTIEMSGASAQSIPANTFYNNDVYNLVINNSSGSGVSLGGALDIYNSLTYSGTTRIFNTNDYLTLKSNANGTAYVGDMTGNTINGKVTVERYLQARKGWRLLSVPTNTTQTISAAWQEGCGANTDCVPGYGTQITGAAGTSGGFDVATSAPSIKTYDGASSAWTGVATTNSTNIKTNSGYMIFVRGDRSVITSTAAANSTILRTKGTLYTGTQSAINVPASQFAVIGNPYASALDMRNISKSGMKDFFYVWDPMLGGAYGYGAFQTFSNNGSGDYVVTPGGGSYGTSGSISDYIQSGQAFFMQGGSSGGSVTMTESAKTSGSSLVNVPAGMPLPSLTVNLYGVKTDSSTYMADGFLVNYGNSYSDSVDDMDAIKPKNSSENLGDMRNGNLLVIERRRTIQNQDTIFFNLTNVYVQNYRFVISSNGLTQRGLSAVLVDNYLHKNTPLQIDGSATVNFNIANIPGSYAANRFEIVFTQSPTGILPVTFTSVEAIPQNNLVDVLWTVANESNISQYVVQRSADGNHFSNITTLAPTANNGGSSSYQATDNNPLLGIDYYRIASYDVHGAVIYSNIVKVQLSASGSGFSIYPNPIQGNIIHITFLNKSAGKYKIRLFNGVGQMLYGKTVTISNGTSQADLTVSRKLPGGIYHLEIIDPSGEMKALKLIR